MRMKVLVEVSMSRGSQSRRADLSSGFQGLIQETVRSFRWHLAGMSVAWLMVVLLNVEPTQASGPYLGRRTSPPSQRLLFALREHQRLLMELLQAPVEPAATVPHAVVPPRRNDSTASRLVA